MATIDWYGGTLEAAFAAARAQARPLLLYWGAAWCPPCNRSRAGLFAAPDVVAASARFVPFFLDGDAAGAQRQAARLGLRSYPTLVLYGADGAEITRLPNEPDAETGAALLTVALAASTPAAQWLAAALSASRALSDDEWRLLSYYSWDTDEDRLLAGRPLAALLTELARLCPPGDSAVRFGLQALALAAPGSADDAAAARLLAVIGDARLARANLDILIHDGIAAIDAAAPPQSALRVRLLTALHDLARRWSDDLGLGMPDRMAALRLSLRLQRPADEAGRAVLAAAVAALVAATDDAFARHSVVNIAAGTLDEAGLPGAADALLRDELPRSHSPFYFMQLLAAHAGRRGDTEAMLAWHEQAWRTARGPATRLQWGANYLLKLLEATATDHARIEAAAAGMLVDVAATPDAFCQRNRSQLQRLVPKLAGRGAGPAATLERLLATELA